MPFGYSVGAVTFVLVLSAEYSGISGASTLISEPVSSVPGERRS